MLAQDKLILKILFYVHEEVESISGKSRYDCDIVSIGILWYIFSMQKEAARKTQEIIIKMVQMTC